MRIPGEDVRRGNPVIQSRFFFATSGRSRLCYSTITDITEKRHERERSRVALLYDFALSEESGEIYECNLTRNTFRIIRALQRDVPPASR